MPPLTPEQQAFAEEHHGLILDFMEKHSLDDDYYGLLAQRYLKVVVRYLTEEELRKYSFSTVVIQLSGIVISPPNFPKEHPLCRRHRQDRN